MNVAQMKIVLAEILRNTDLTPCVVGHRGVGKTAGIVQVCGEIGRRYVALRLGQMEVGDLVGIPYRDGDVMHWSRPSWWPGDDDPQTVIHCDELNRAQQEDTLQAIFQFVEPPATGQLRRLHTHALHPRHKVVVSINPPDGSYQVATLDRALLDRMVMIYVETDYHCWARYAKQQQFDAGVQQFLAAYPNLLARAGAPLDMQMEPTERAWEMVSTLRKACRFPVELEMEVYAGIVGQEAAVSFLRWTREQAERPVTARQVLDRWPAGRRTGRHPARRSAGGDPERRGDDPGGRRRPVPGAGAPPGGLCRRTAARPAVRPDQGAGEDSGSGGKAVQGRIRCGHPRCHRNDQPGSLLTVPAESAA